MRVTSCRTAPVALHKSSLEGIADWMTEAGMRPPLLLALPYTVLVGAQA